jgi:hypothetical protein
MVYHIQTEAQKKRTPTSTYEFGAHLFDRLDFPIVRAII